MLTENEQILSVQRGHQATIIHAFDIEADDPTDEWEQNGTMNRLESMKFF